MSRSSRSFIRFRRRGQLVELSDISPRLTLLDWLRQEDRAIGTKEGCAEGDCGACTIALRRGRTILEPVNACILFLGQVDGAEVLTIEDLARDGTLHPVQRAMVDAHGSQCGFCTPGIVMSLFVRHETGSSTPTRAEIDDALAGNLCRCTGYRPIADAALQASAEPKTLTEPFQPIDDGRDVFVGDDERFFASPASETALAALYARHPDATLVAGATDVGLWVTKGLVDIRKVIWLGRVAGFDTVDRDGDRLVIAAGATHAQVYESLAALDPDLGEIMRRFGSVQVRASGTVGGNIANGSPIGDLAPCFIALGATLEQRRFSGGETRSRAMALEDFFLDYRKQDRLPGEYVARIVVPVPRPGAIVRAFKVSKRLDEDISAVMGAFHFHVEDLTIRSSRIAYGGMAGIPKRARLAEAALVGVAPDDEAAWQPALDALAADFTPLTDQRASAAYRAKVARNLLVKALIEAAGAGTDVTRIVGRREVAHAAE